MAQTYSDKPTLEAWNAILGKPELIKTVTLSRNSYYAIDWSDVDWSEWTLVFFGLDKGAPSTDTALMSVTINNGQKRGSSTSDDGEFCFMKARPFRMALFPLHDPSRAVRGIYIGASSGVCIGDCTFENLQDMFLQYSGNIRDETMQIWGIR